jgi:HK97 family phage portal protein
VRNPFRRRPAVEEQRALTWLPWDVGGSRYDQPRAEEATRLAPVWAAVRFLVDGVSTLPLKAYRVDGDARQPITMPALIRQRELAGQLEGWLGQAVYGLAMHGNAIGLVTQRDGMQFATQVDWRPRAEWSVDDTSGRPRWYWNGRPVPSEDVVHIPWLSVPGQTLALSPVDHYARTVSTGLGAQEYGSDWFRNGGVPPGKFQNSEKVIKREDASEISSRLTDAIRSHRPLVYGKDWTYEPIAIPPEQAQFIQTHRLIANQVAAIYGIAPDEIGGEAANSLTYSTEELRQIRRMADLRPWLVRFENALSALLPERQYVRFTAAATVRADIRTRFDVYSIARSIGAMSVDEIRALEERPPLPNGEGAEFAPLRAGPPAAQPDAEQQQTGEAIPIDGSRRWQIPA